jgi:hypothetical protein
MNRIDDGVRTHVRSLPFATYRTATRHRSRTSSIAGLVMRSTRPPGRVFVSPVRTKQFFLKAFEENLSKVEHYCYVEKNFTVPAMQAIEQIFGPVK